MTRPEPSRPDSSKPEPSNKLVYYPLLGLGFVFLVGWFYLMRELNFMEWLAQFGPSTHKGSFNMLAIMLWMIPSLLVWKYYLRWLNRRFEIGGQHDQDRHDAMYKDSSPTDARPDDADTGTDSVDEQQNNNKEQP